MKFMYDAWYRWGTPPWVGGPREELVRLVTNKTLTPGRAIDLGCGEGDNAIFLAQHGFTVTAVDFAQSAVAKAREKARLARAEVDFIVDDLTHLRNDVGVFDLLVDFGTLDDLGHRQRDQYVSQVLPLARPGAHFLLWCFEWELGRLERLLTSVLPVGKLALAPGEAERRFGKYFEIDRVAGETDLAGWPKGWAAYLMTRRSIGQEGEQAS